MLSPLSRQYDQKFIREETLIFFIRNRLAPNTPFVTLEYSLKNHKVLQCYAYGDTRPAEQVLEFVNKTWLPYANRKIKKLARSKTLGFFMIFPLIQGVKIK